MKAHEKMLAIGSLLAFVLLVLSDPRVGLISNLPVGYSTIESITRLMITTLYVGVLYLLVKGVLGTIDIHEVYVKAMRSSEGSGMVFIGISVIWLAVALVIFATT